MSRYQIVRAGAVRLARPLRFGAVGASGVAVNTLALWLAAGWLGLPVWLAGVLASEAAILSNFVLNDRWTFRGQAAAAGPLRRLLRYNGVALGGMTISVATLAALSGAGVPLLAANLAGVAAATAWNYAASSRWAWRGAAVDHV